MAWSGCPLQSGENVCFLKQLLLGIQKVPVPEDMPRDRLGTTCKHGQHQVAGRSRVLPRHAIAWSSEVRS